MLQMSGFTFENRYERSSLRLMTNLAWKNTGTVAITAFEVVVAYYDPFNRRIPGAGGVWLVPGRDSGDWRPLEPGMASADGLIGSRDQLAMTAFGYVRAIRLEDGTVWYFDRTAVEEEIRRLLPEVREVGNLDPEIERGR